MTSTADAPSVSGDEVPAVTVPSARKAGASPASTSAVVPGRRQPSIATSPLGGEDRRDLVLQPALRSRLGGLALRLDGECLLALARDAEALGDLLGGLAHREVELRVGRGQSGWGT